MECKIRYYYSNIIITAFKNDQIFEAREIFISTGGRKVSIFAF